MMTVHRWQLIYRIRDQLMNTANSTDGNRRYIFGGYKTESAPFATADGTYNGGTQNVTQQVDAARTMVIGHTGDKIFAELTSNAVPEPAGGTRGKEPVQNAGYRY